MRWVVLLLTLSGCAAYQRNLACRDEIGPRPVQIASVLYAFGPLGGILAESVPERAAWNERVNACVHRREAAGA